MMFKNRMLIFLIIIVICGWAAAASYSPHTYASTTVDAVVGTGTPASCKEANFDTAFNTVQSSGGGTIIFDCGSGATITFTDQKTLLANTTLEGDGVITLSGGKKNRLFFINTGLSLTLQDVTLRDGSAAVGGGLIEIFGGEVDIIDSQLLDSTAVTDGGAINCSIDQAGAVNITRSVLSGNMAKKGGAIYSGGCDVTIKNSEFKNNKAPAANSGVAFGGAVAIGTPGELQVQSTLFEGNEGYNGGALNVETGATATITGSSFTRNKGGYGAGIENHGTTTVESSLFTENEADIAAGGIWNIDGELSVFQGTFRSNSGGIGGAIVNYGKTMTLEEVTVDGNRATKYGGGGGIYTNNGTTEIYRSTISNNSTELDNGHGGGIYHAGDTLKITDTTITGNRAATASGGGLSVWGGDVFLVYATLADNQAPEGSQIYSDPTGTSNKLSLFGTALAGDAQSCAGKSFASLGYNISEGPCSSLVLTGDKENAGSLLLGSLQDNGGLVETLTMLPAVGSQLVDAIPTDQCHPTQSRDQRLLQRPEGNGCDVGAVERHPEDFTEEDLVVGSGSPESCTEAAFESALAAAHVLAGSVTFDCSTASISLTSTKTISAAVRIDGGGKITLSGGNQTPHFLVAGPTILQQANVGGDLTLENIVLADGYSFVDGGSIENRGSLTLRRVTIRNSKTDPTYAGGAIANYGKLAVAESVLENNEAGNGGALYLVNSEGSASINDSILRGNKAVAEETTGFGGAIILWDGARVETQRTRFENNKAVSGGAIYGATADTSIGLFDRTAVDNNEAASEKGGGIVNHGTMDLNLATVSNNMGSGVENHGNLRAVGSTFRGNVAEGGAGILNRDHAVVINVTFSGNEAALGAGFYNHGTADLKHVTFAGNQANSGAAIYHNADTAPGTLIMQNVIFDQGVTGDNCLSDDKSITSITSLGYNLSSDSSCLLTQATDHQNTDPLLGPLADNGGPTLTHLPLAGSPAIDAGKCVSGLKFDQRALPRFQGTACDIGAVEIQLGGGLTDFIYLPVVIK